MILVSIVFPCLYKDFIFVHFLGAQYLYICILCSDSDSEEEIPLTIANNGV